jgi:hypothetical protein
MKKQELKDIKAFDIVLTENELREAIASYIGRNNSNDILSVDFDLDRLRILVVEQNNNK